MNHSLPQLPTMRCDDGCGECCTIAPCSREELALIRNVVKAQGIKPLRQGLRCPLYIDGKCSVYYARPLVCRLYGHAPGLDCLRGYSVLANDKTLEAWNAEMRKVGDRVMYTHELVYDVGEMFSTLMESTK